MKCLQNLRGVLTDPHESEEAHKCEMNGDARHRRVSRMVEEVQSIMLELTTQISSWDSRFQSIANSGIHSDNLKVLAPSQLLVTVPLRGLSGFRQKSSRRWRYYTTSGVRLLSPVMEPEKLHQWLEVEQFQKSSGNWHDTDVTIQGDLVPARVLSALQELLQRAIPARKLTSSFSTSRKARWPRFFKRWPSKDSACCVKSFGFDLIARTNYHWQLSFLRAERLLLEGIDEDGGCRMKCLRVIRQLKEDVWCPGSRPVITSQHLQMILLWQCERNPSSKAWLYFGSCFLRLVRRLLKCSRQRFLRHYFVRRANLLKYADTNQLDKLADKLSRFLQSPTLNLSSYYDHASVC
ncbi:protein mab-21-like 3 [Rhinoderma darwinii]|uniref:protein mab-21-like 3 n=1 Tax=Rhinoderma darwinii TaxID=43563 RepID=UPI003F673149